MCFSVRQKVQFVVKLRRNQNNWSEPGDTAVEDRSDAAGNGYPEGDEVKNSYNPNGDGKLDQADSGP